MNKTTEQVSGEVTPPELRNPTGKGGFGDNPGNRSPGGWKKEDSVSYQYKMLLRLSVSDFKQWVKTNPDTVRTTAQDLAYQAVRQAGLNIHFLKEVTDRTEGKSPMAPEDREASGIELSLPDNPEDAELLVTILNKHHDYVSC